MTRFSFVAAAVLLAGCSPEPQGDSYFPMNVGSSWTYDLTSDIDGAITHETQVSSVPRTITSSTLPPARTSSGYG